MNNPITFSQALEGYLLYADASRLSPHTIADYTNTFRKFQDFLSDDPPINEITVDQVRQFMAAQDHISKKTLLNYHTGLSALWTWATEEELVEHHIIKRVPRPDPEKPAIKPYTRDDVEAMLAACKSTRRYVLPSKNVCHRSRPTAHRDKAIILVLVDTGIRASELCKITIADEDLPDRLTEEPLPNGPARGMTVAIQPMVRDSYAAMGWDADGQPTPEKL
jgi:integrase/recombinase XerD